MIARIVIFLLPFLWANCNATDLAPDTVSVDLQHLSHTLQHFGSDPTNYGSEILSLKFQWDFGRFHFIVKEGGTFGGGHEDILGPREVFQADVVFDIWKKN